MQHIETHYYGIYIQEDEGEWWICDDSTGDEYFGSSRPTDDDVEIYRQHLIDTMSY